MNNPTAQSFGDPAFLVRGILLAAFIAGLLSSPNITTAADDNSTKAATSRPARDATSPKVTAAKINQLLGTNSSDQVDDFAYLRRVYFDTIGFPPTARNVREFVSDNNSEKRAAIVAKLIDDKLYGKNWGQYWCDVIMYRRSEDRALRVAPTVTEYLADSLNQGEAWNTLATSFITATGDIQKNGETGLIAAQAGRPEETVAEISRIFLGVQIQCAQCHDHFTDSWTRDQFHELAAFFPRTALRPNRDGDKRTFVVTSVDRTPRRKPKNADRHIGASEHYMPDLDNPKAKGTLMTPAFFLTGEELELGTRDLDRRTQLAEWITDSPWFTKSLVNRLWTDLVGSGFFSTVDDIGPERTCEHEETLDYLADEFEASGFDLKWLLQTIMATDVYQTASQSRIDDGSWSPTRNHPIRLRADQLFNSVTQLFGGGAKLSRPERQKMQRRARMIFAANFGFDPSLPQDDISGSVPQALMLMNSEIIDRQLSGRRPGGIATAMDTLDDDEKLVRYLYLRCLSRPPAADELNQAIKYVQQSENRKSGFHDLVWSLLNCSEFMYRG